jgi:crotonobetainyl-CoA:carnitine CoA-transferase CaiB-like acyl-CoA transferase
MTGLYAVIAIQAALAARERTGQGDHIDMALFDTMVGVLGNQALNYLVSGISPKRMGNAHPNIAPYAVYPTRDGWFILAVGNDGQFGKFCEIAGCPQLLGDPRFVGNAARLAHRDVLEDAVRAATSQWARDDLLAALAAAGVPAGPINTVADAFSDPQIVSRGMQLDLAADDGTPCPAFAPRSALPIWIWRSIDPLPARGRTGRSSLFKKAPPF